jgi:glutathione S-transferase
LHFQVPVLVSNVLAKPIADSLEITHFLAERYPSLIPSSHKDQVTALLKDLHALNYFSLSFPGREHVAEEFKQSVFKRLAHDDISPRYRDALTFKLGV